MLVVSDCAFKATTFISIMYITNWILMALLIYVEPAIVGNGFRNQFLSVVFD